jgi:hypothetical protein
MRFPQMLIKKPHTILLIDALGAVLTSVLLISLVPFLAPNWTNSNEFYPILPLFAGIMALNSFIGFLFFKNKWTFYLQIIASLNCVYCLISILILINSHNSISELTILYFILEILIVVSLVYTELTLISLHKKSNR